MLPEISPNLQETFQTIEDLRRDSTTHTMVRSDNLECAQYHSVMSPEVLTHIKTMLDKMMVS